MAPTKKGSLTAKGLMTEPVLLRNQHNTLLLVNVISTLQWKVFFTFSICTKFLCNIYQQFLQKKKSSSLVVRWQTKLGCVSHSV